MLQLENVINKSLHISPLRQESMFKKIHFMFLRLYCKEHDLLTRL